MLRKAIEAHWRIIATAMLILLLVVTAKIARSNYDRAITAESSIASSAAVTKNVISAMNLINDISKVAHEDKQTLQQKGETHVVYISQALKGDPCGNQPVPSAAIDSLRELKDSLRTGSSSSDKR